MSVQVKTDDTKSSIAPGWEVDPVSGRGWHSLKEGEGLSSRGFYNWTTQQDSFQGNDKHQWGVSQDVSFDRPARRQVEERNLQRAENAGEYNIWYHKYMGDYDTRGARGAAATRCVIQTDAGKSAADLNMGYHPLCMHFARGSCCYGAECTFFHRPPNDKDESALTAMVDIFGRDRHRTHKDDMGGTGTWSRDCRTLYVSGIGMGTMSENEMMEVVQRHFGEWGEIQYLRVLRSKACAFVQYRLRGAAEFAKEAMMDQSLDNGEQLNVRWAYDDPNPKVQTERQRCNAVAVVEALKKRGHIEIDYDQFYQPDDKKQKGDEAGPMTQDELEAREEAQKEKDKQEMQQQQQKASLNKLDAILGGIGGDGEVEYDELPPGIDVEPECGIGLPPGWKQATDPTSACVYYYNESSGESSWEWPGFSYAIAATGGDAASTTGFGAVSQYEAVVAESS